ISTFLVQFHLSGNTLTGSVSGYDSAGQLLGDHMTGSLSDPSIRTWSRDEEVGLKKNKTWHHQLASSSCDVSGELGHLPLHSFETVAIHPQLLNMAALLLSLPDLALF
ncbi:hypothetical protein BgiBS90_014460, partial [Biomphalaria glabrata]